MPGTTSAPPSFSHEQHHTTDAAKRKGCKYWLLNITNEHASNYSRIKQTQRMRQCTINTHTWCKSTEQTKDHVPWICLPQGDLPAVYLRYTNRSSALLEGRVLLGVFHPYLWPLKAPESTLGGVSPNSRQPTDASTPSSWRTDAIFKFIFIHQIW